MSWSTRTTRAPNCSGDPLDDPAHVLGLLLREARGGLVEQDDARAPTTARATSTSRRSRASRPPPSRPGRRGRRTRSPRARPAARLPARLRVLVDHGDVLEHRQRARSPARSGMSVGGPSGHGGSRPSSSRSSPKTRIDPAAGLTKPESTLKNVVLPGAVRADQAARAAGERDLTPSIGVTPAKRTVRFSTSITPSLGAFDLRRNGAPDAGRGSRDPSGAAGRAARAP